jgi:hypothetical protein
VADLLATENVADLGDETRQLASEVGPRQGGFGMVLELLADQVLQGRESAVPHSDGSSCLALVPPDVLKFFHAVLHAGSVGTGTVYVTVLRMRSALSDSIVRCRFICDIRAMRAEGRKRFNSL